MPRKRNSKPSALEVSTLTPDERWEIAFQELVEVHGYEPERAMACLRPYDQQPGEYEEALEYGE